MIIYNSFFNFDYYSINILKYLKFFDFKIYLRYLIIIIIKMRNYSIQFKQNIFIYNVFKIKNSLKIIFFIKIKNEK